MSTRRFARRYADSPAQAVIHAAVSRFGSRVVVTTSFGIQSAVLLHMVSRIAPATPVVWIDTGYLPPETYRYADRLAREFDLNLHVYQSTVSPARMEALHGRLWEEEDPQALDRYHHLRKVEPLDRALRDLRATAWLAGVRRAQTEHRAGLPRVQRQGRMCKIHPILDWSDDDVERYFREHDLPRHPLAEQGYLTVGDAQLSRPVAPGETDPRASRFGGRKQECGIHTAGFGGADGAGDAGGADGAAGPGDAGGHGTARRGRLPRFSFPTASTRGSHG